MPKAKRRKDSGFQKSMTKSVFLYGSPNAGKLAALTRMQASFTALVNRDIRLLAEDASVFLQLVKNDKKDPDMRRLEKSIRPSGLNSAFCQNAFDAAVTHLSNRLNDIRLDMLAYHDSLLARSKVLFAMTVMGASRQDMIRSMHQIGQAFHLECAEALEQMPDAEFRICRAEFMDLYAMSSMEYRIPELKRVSVPLDSRLMKLERSDNTKMPYVITITDPEQRGKRIAVPINTSAHALHKIQSNDMAGTVMMQVHHGVLKIGWSYDRKFKQPWTDSAVGVDTGISDALHTSDGRSIGSMKQVIDFYHDTVEPAFAQLSDLRNKKRAIKHYIRRHTLPETVKNGLVAKMDRLERMIRTIEAPYRKKRHYYAMLDHEIRTSVKAYTDTLSPGILTVLEKLDMKEFHKSRTVNGMFSVFARGKLQKAMMDTLNWKGYDFLEVAPDYTSQVCPVCSNLDAANRNQKTFFCTCCGYQDDADHVGAMNIRARAQDEEILDICRTHRFRHKDMQNAMKIVYSKRNVAYKKQQTTAASA